MPESRGGVEGIRRANLARLLELLHHDGEATRAELTRRTGLNRSTVGALVAELERLGLALESPGVAEAVGRPSPRVRVADRVVAIAVNPEVDAVTVGAVGLGARVHARIRSEVRGELRPDDAALTVARAVAQLRAGPLRDARIVGLGAAVPGLVREDGFVRWAPHLGWNNVPFATLLERATGIRAVAANDATLGAVVERRFGAARGVDDLVYLNGGASGIGGGVVAGGRPLTGWAGYAGEFGHVRAAGLDDPRDRLSERGMLEDEVRRSRLLEILGLHSADETELATALAASTDPAVGVELGRQRRVLGASLGAICTALNPRVVVLGGFLAAVHASGPDDVVARLADAAIGPVAEGVEVVPAALGADRLLVGAAELAFAALLADPAGVLAG